MNKIVIRAAVVAGFVLSSLFFASATEPPDHYLGMTPAELFSVTGSPDEVFPLRGVESEQDDVVFYFSSGIYAYFFQNRVWQLSADDRYTGSVQGISIGMGKEEVESVLGPPFSEFRDTLIYNIADLGYPVRLRIFFTDEQCVNEMYYYRADY